MKREVYDKVQEYISKHKECTMKQAFEATKTSAGTYYNQAKSLTPSKRGRAKTTYDIVPLKASYEPPSQGMVKPGMVGVIGAPEDIARLLLRLARGEA